MAKQKKQRFEGIVYSTDSTFEYESDNTEIIESLPAKQQKLRVELDKKSRKGKVVTLISGFICTDDDLQDLAKILKQKCGVGGSAKEGEILIQGDFKQKIFELLKSLDYQVKLVGG
ncbi:translation initiation factor [Sphingobacterium bovistauri]|uniref:Translation initiation factor n=1 Tax=Sphingobacterium bovistauri TaxID=2781959 RepID=A0ABS7Z2Z1_9SPHI|nr:translation initiation factor [Sphingobacterium bovistauri]MCA5003962.1 translation initiation factor [Sphingobacterium bovistauri]